MKLKLTAVALLALLLTSSAAFAQESPAAPPTIVMPGTVGGAEGDSWAKAALDVSSSASSATAVILRFIDIPR